MNKHSTPNKHTDRVIAKEPYLTARKRPDAFTVEGAHQASFGHRLPSGLTHANNGIFAGWQWDGQQLQVHNDRYGLQPLFWANLPDGGLSISTSPIRLIDQGAPAELDVEALAVFFRLGFFVGDDTPFRAIKAVPPNAIFKWQQGRLECHGRYPEQLQQSSLARDDAIDAYIDLFAKAIAKRAPTSGNFAVPISGGRDSRHILLELHRTGFVPEICVSAWDNPPDPNQDPLIGRELCEALGFKHTTVDQRLSLLAAQVRKNHETHFCARSHGWYLALADFLNYRFDSIYDGIAGDVLSQSGNLNSEIAAAFNTCNAQTACTALLAKRPHATRTLKRLLKGDLHDAADPQLASTRLEQEVVRHFHKPNPVGSFYFWNRTRRQIALAPYSLLQGIPNVYAPFLDHDLFDFLSTLPVDMLMDRTFHDDAIARAYPAFAHIPYADHKHAPPADDSAIQRCFLAQASRRFLLSRPWSLMKNIEPRAKILAGYLSGGRWKPDISQLIIYLDQIESVIKRG